MEEQSGGSERACMDDGDFDGAEGSRFFLLSCQGFLSVATKSEEMTQSRYVVVVGSERGPSHGSLKSRRTVRALTRLLQRERATKEARAKKDFFFKTGHDELRRFGSFGQGEVVALPPSLPAFFP